MTRHFLPALLLATLLYGIAPPAAQAQSVVSPPDVRALKPGEFLWYPQIAPEGPVVLVVSLDEQRAYVYRNGIAIGVTTISSGKTGKETPTGVFTILQKNKDHRSNLYNDAPMPYMQRLTWDGIALHGGHLPGYPASHGCVRLPQAFAEKLFGITRFGDSVVVANAKASPASVVHPAVLAPVIYVLASGTLWYSERSIVAAIVVMSALLAWRHKENIARLIQGKESRLGSKGKDKGAPAVAAVKAPHKKHKRH